MKRIILIILFLFSLTCTGWSQSWSWLAYDTLYTPNGSAIPGPLVEMTRNADVYMSWREAGGLYFSQHDFSRQRIDRFDAAGNRLRSFSLGRRVSLTRIIAVPDGDLLVLGSFMDTLRKDSTVLLLNTQPDSLSRNVFLLRMDSMGNIRWSRNMTVSHPDWIDDGVATAQENGVLWYAYSDFSSGNIIALNSAGQDSVVYPIAGTSSVLFSDIAQDASGALYLAGAVGSGTLTWSGIPFTITHSYNRFIAKLDVTGNIRWFQTIQDITFNSPRISVDDSAHIYMTDWLPDSTTIGPFHLQGPDWVFDFMLARWDSTGTVQWAVDVPNPPTITGDVRLSWGKSISATSTGCRLLGYYRGMVDWGNGVVIGGGTALTNQGLVLMTFDSQGQLLRQAGIQAINGLYPGMLVSSEDMGYFTGTGTGSLLVDSTLIQAATPSSFFSFVVRFSDSFSSLVADITRTADIRIAPNPTSNGRLTLLGGNRKESVKVMDIQGHVLYTSEIIDCSGPCSFETGLPSGYYRVLLESGRSLPWIIMR